ncbi:excinuclease ABC subunit A [Vannielia litorea]|nr:excinuclease ABC subunit A [Vannielia litorea]MBY6074307.1 excinuclease ABC subunit A [Vannielia litorea]
MRGCPPGLAKKSPACVPPGQAKKRVRADDDRHYRINVGSRLDRDDYVIVRPWQYGLEPAPGGSRYAVYDGVLVRIDEDTAEVLDLIRAVGAVAN